VKSAQGRSALRGLEARFYGRLEVATPERLGDLLADSGELFSGSSSCRSHDRLARCDFSWKGSSGAPWPRLRLERREQRERSESDLCRRRSRELQEIEMRWTIRTGFTVRGQLGQEIEREGIEEQGGADDASHVDERKSRHAAAELTWKVLHPVTLRTGMDERRERFEISGAQRSSTQLKLAAIVELRRSGRIELAGERRWVEGGTGGGGPFAQENGGWNITLTGSLRPGSSVTTSLRLRVEEQEDRSTVTSGRMEVRAFF
jgi:hypothetical protein